MEVGRFYQRSGNWLAATIRFRNVVDKYQTTSHTPEALERLVETYLALGIPARGAQGRRRARRATIPDSEWYKRAYRADPAQVAARPLPQG